MVTVSPAVSPSVVAAILMIQNTSVTSGTLLAVRSTMFISRPPMRSDAARRQYYSQRFLSMVWLSLAREEERVTRRGNIDPLLRRTVGIFHPGAGRAAVSDGRSRT